MEKPRSEDYLEYFKVEMPQSRRSEDEASKEDEAGNVRGIVDAG